VALAVLLLSLRLEALSIEGEGEPPPELHAASGPEAARTRAIEARSEEGFGMAVAACTERSPR
jgi:hypothetical protein